MPNPKGTIKNEPLKSRYSSAEFEAGCDEAGRGCLAGPVVAAAVILPNNFYHPLLNDSKQVGHKQRYELRKIIENEALDYAVAFIDNTVIDKINILNASISAMHLALDKLTKKPEFVIVDGNRFKPWNNTEYKTIIKGDALYLSIAAASILAKTYRDDYMIDLSNKFPEYNWKQNKGYPTAQHRNAIKIYGTTSFHRLSFNLLDRQLKFNV